jgi:hypothetical protein
MAAIAELTEASESTSITEMRIGSCSRAAISASSGEFDGLRIVAKTLCPARAKASAVSKPIPRLVPVMRTEDILTSLEFGSESWAVDAGAAIVCGFLWGSQSLLGYANRKWRRRQSQINFAKKMEAGRLLSTACEGQFTFPS